MNTQRLAAFLLIAGFVVALVSFPFSVPGLYATSDPQARVQIVEQYRTNWVVDHVLTGLFILLLGAGFAVLAWHWRNTSNIWITALGGTAFVVGTVSAMIFVYLQAARPLSAFGGDYLVLEYLYYWLVLAGLLSFGVVFLLNDLPAWLGYLTLGATLAFIVVILVSGGGWFATPAIEILLGIVIAVVLLVTVGRAQRTGFTETMV